MGKKEIRVIGDNWRRTRLIEQGYAFTQKGKKPIFYIPGELVHLCRKALFRRLRL